MINASFLGAGLHTTLGQNVAECVAALRGALPQPSLLPCTLGGHHRSVPYFLLAGLSADDEESRIQQAVNKAIAEAIDAAGLNLDEQERMALFVGSSSFDIASEERRYERALQSESGPIPLAECGMGNLAEDIRARLGLRGEEYTFNTACTSSANALWYACKMVEMGLIQHALVLGIEFLNNTTTYGFQGLQLLSPTAMRPFDSRRDGLVLGESCAALVVGKSQSGSGFHLRGAANACDTYSMSTTREDGSAVESVIRAALASAGIDPPQISAIKCHGTATLSGDAAEACGMLRTFGTLPPCTSLKPFLGHTLGACGLTELILFCAAVQQGFLPATPDVAADAESIGFALNQRILPMAPGHFMLNYFGFGGNSTSLVISNVEKREQP